MAEFIGLLSWFVVFAGIGLVIQVEPVWILVWEAGVDFRGLHKNKNFSGQTLRVFKSLESESRTLDSRVRVSETQGLKTQSLCCTIFSPAWSSMRANWVIRERIPSRRTNRGIANFLLCLGGDQTADPSRAGSHPRWS